MNREMEARIRALAGIKAYVTNLAACPDGTPVSVRRAIPRSRRCRPRCAWDMQKFRRSRHFRT